MADVSLEEQEEEGEFQRPWGWSQYFVELGEFLATLEHHYGIANQHFAEYTVERLMTSLQNVSHLCSCIDEADSFVIANVAGDLHQLKEILSSLLAMWQRYEESTLSVDNFSYNPPLEPASCIGRRRFLISGDQLEYLRALSFTWTEITSLFGVTRMTVYCRQAECGLIDEQRDVLSDADLDSMILELKGDLPYCGLD